MHTNEILATVGTYFDKTS